MDKIEDLFIFINILTYTSIRYQVVEMIFYIYPTQ